MRRLPLSLFFLFLVGSASQAQTVAITCNGSDTLRFTGALAYISSNPGKIKVGYRATPCKINSVTIPSNVILDLSSGTGIYINTGQTLSIPVSSMVAPANRIFFNALSGQGSVIFTTAGEVKTEWWGSSDQGINVNAADTALGSNPGTIVSGAGTYSTQVNLSSNHVLHLRAGFHTIAPTDCVSPCLHYAPIRLKDDTQVIGEGPATIISEPSMASSDTVGTWRVFYSYSGSLANENWSKNIHISDLKIVGANPFFDSVQGAISLHNCHHCSVRRVTLDGTRSLGIGAGGSSHATNSRLITNCTNTSPIVCTTSTAHGLVKGHRVNISGVVGNTAANGSWMVDEVLSSTTVSLAASAGNGAYISGGKLTVNNNAEDVVIEDNTLINVASQNLFCVNCKNFSLSNNRFFSAGQKFSGFINTNGTAVTYVNGQDFSRWSSGHAVVIGDGSYTIAGCTTPTTCNLTSGAGIQNNVQYSYLGPGATYIDVEPNSTTDLLEGYRVDGNIIDARGSANSGNGILLQAVAGVSAIGPGTINDNVIIGGTIIPGQITNNIANGIYLVGLQDTTVVGNTVRRTGQSGLNVSGSRLVLAKNQLTCVGGGGTEGFRTLGLTNSLIAGNQYNDVGTCGSTSPILIEDNTSSNNTYEGNVGFVLRGIQSSSRRVLNRTPRGYDDFANLGTAANGSLEWCSDCTQLSPTTAGGPGALVRREGGAWNAGVTSAKGLAFAAPGEIGGTTAAGTFMGSANNSLTINEGSPVTRILSATATLDFDLTSVATQDLTISVIGAALGDAVLLGVPSGSVTANTQFFAFVSANNTVTVRAMRIAGTPNPSRGTFRATVVQF